MQRLQQEAVRRVREMQSRAQIASQPQGQPQQHQENRGGPGNGGQENGRGGVPNGGQRGPNNSQNTGNGGGQNQPHGQELRAASGQMHPVQPETHSPELLRLLFQNEDRTLILLLILLLLEENQDPSLLLALLYLAMSPE